MNIDPTAIIESLPLSGDTPWSVDDVAAAQADAAASDADGGPSPAADVAYETHRSAPHPPPVTARTTTAPAATPRAGFASDTPQRRAVSGRYRSQGPTQLELRVDVDGLRPLRRLSGDFFRRSGGTLSYVGSFAIHTPTITVTPSEVRIEGEGTYTFQTAAPRLRVTIPRVTQFAPRAAATAQFINPSGANGASYNCPFESEFFRRVEFEQDFVQHVTPFDSYNTGALPSGGPARVLNVTGAFAEAGIEMLPTGASNQVEVAMAGADAVWSRSEIHAAMVDHFSLWEDLPGWRVWMLAATQDEEGNRGVMFDQQGSQRQGCAVFHNVIGGNTNEIVRAQLRTYVHELGHCFNLYHSHQKGYMTPPQPDRLDALSWMHYPHYYQSVSGSGEVSYWRNFPFQFDDPELVHLRHAFRNDIIMGGNPFGLGAADVDPQKFADPVEDNSGLRLRVRAAGSVALGEPVVLGLQLETTDTRGKVVNQRLHPNASYVQVGIVQPGGKTVVYRPFIKNCAEPEMVTLNAERPLIRDSAYIGYGQDGFYFAAPGVYSLRAVYHAPDGSKVFSDTIKLRVRAPVDRQEDELAGLFLGEEQGQLLYLLGSDSHFLADGNDALDLVIDKHAAHPFAVFAKMIKGINASRDFKIIRGYKVEVRPARNADSERLLSDVLASAAAPPSADPTADANLDAVTVLQVMSRLNNVQLETGDVEKARETAKMMMTQARKVPGRVEAQAREQAGAQLAADPAGADGDAHAGSRPPRAPRKRGARAPRK